MWLMCPLHSTAHTAAGLIPQIKLGGVGQDNELNMWIDYTFILKSYQKHKNTKK